MIRAVGDAANKLVAGLQGSPILLGLLVLNGIGIAAAVWFLERILKASHENMQAVLKACLPHGG